MTSPGTRTLRVKIDGDAKGLDPLGKQAERTLLGIDKQADRTSQGARKMDRAFGSAVRSMNADLDKLEREMWETGDGMDEAFTRSIRDMRGDLVRLASEGRQTGATLDSELGGSLLEVRKRMGDLSDEMHQSGSTWADNLREGLSGGFDAGSIIDGFAGNLTAAGGTFLAAGGVLAGWLWQGFQDFSEQQRVGGLIAAKSGETSASANQLGKLAGRIFAGGFGDSVESVGDAISAVLTTGIVKFGSASESTLRRVAESVLTLQATTGESANNIARSARTLLVTGMARSLSQAFDMIQRAQERGLNVSEDLLDTIDEYSTQFRSLGLNGQQAFGLLSQAVQGGARDTDVAADSLKEFQLLATDAASTAARGFQALGLDAARAMEGVARGGKPAQEVLRQVLDRLRSMPDSVARNSIAMDLFGTKAEDMGNALFDMDLDTAIEQFGDFDGAVDQANKTMTDSTPAFEKMGRNIKQWSVDVINALDDVKGTLESDAGPLSWDSLFGSGGDAANDAAGGAENAADSMDKVAESTSAASSSTEDYVGNIDQLIKRQREIQTGAIDLIDSQIQQAQAFDQAEEAARKFAYQGLLPARDGFDLSTEAGQEMAGALTNVADQALTTVEAMRQQNKSNQEIQAQLQVSKDRFVGLATTMGLNETAARRLADQLFGIPKNIVPVVGIQDFASGPLQQVINRAQWIKNNPRLSQDVYVYTHAMQDTASIRDRSSSYQGRGGRWTGGPVWPGNSYKVGERGEEIFTPTNAGTITANHHMPNGDTHVTVNIDGQEFRGMVRSEIRENSRSTRRSAMAGTGGAR